MKMLLIHSQDIEVQKMLVATASPQEFKDDKISLSGLILVCFISVEDQDTFDINLISTQAANVIREAIDLIEGFPAKLREENEAIEEHNKKVDESGKGKKKELKKLILGEEMYKVDQVIVYPWAHLSKFLNKDKEAKEVFPRTAEILESMGIKATYSPFGWYKGFSIKCLGHEVAEMHRDIKLAIVPEEHIETSVLKIISPEKKIFDVSYNNKGKAILPDEIQGPEYKDLRDFFHSETSKEKRKDIGKQPAHIEYMQKFELVDFDDNTDKGNFRWYTKGMIIKNLIRDINIDKCIDYGAVMVETPIMYTVTNKRLTAQTARFPARTYWVISGDNRYLLRFAGDFLQFSLFADINLTEKHLPLRLYEYEQYDFRREQAGELAGIQRLRAFTMPDLHTLCKDLGSSIEEFRRQHTLTKELMDSFNLESYIIYRTTIPFFEKNKDWIMDLIARENKYALLELWEERYYYFVLKFERAILSEANKSSTLATIQIDVESSLESIESGGKSYQKYNITYKDSNDELKHPIILHTSPSGGVERVLWGMLEQNLRYKGTKVTGFPLWISPIQVRVIPISEKEEGHCEKIMNDLNGFGFRADMDDRNHKVGKKIRTAEVEWIPYTIVIGQKEIESKTFSVRKRLIGQEIEGKNSAEIIEGVTAKDFIKMLKEETRGYPQHKLPIPFRKLSTRIQFR
ncbi:MAG: threonine--tRNA ligase [Candidatus Hodarchaeota archaeon]